MKHRIFIVDDHPLMRRGHAYLINREPDMEVCGEAGSVLDALAGIERTHPDLVVTDISLDGTSGLELIKRLKVEHAGLPVLVVSMHDESLYGERALSAGARGYIMKSQADTDVVDAIRKILRGGFYLSEAMSTKILLQYTGFHDDEAHSPIERLSDRELEVFELIGRGLSTRQVAEALHISPKTVESHRGRIKEKLAIETSTELLQRAVQWTEHEGRASDLLM